MSSFIWTKELLKLLDSKLDVQSYICGPAEPSATDGVVFASLKSVSTTSQYHHITRWLQHISTFQHQALPGEKIQMHQLKDILTKAGTEEVISSLNIIYIYLNYVYFLQSKY